MIETEETNTGARFGSRLRDGLALAQTRIETIEARAKGQWSFLPAALRTALDRLFARVRKTLDLPSQADLAGLLERVEAMDRKLAQFERHRLTADSESTRAAASSPDQGATQGIAEATAAVAAPEIGHPAPAVPKTAPSAAPPAAPTTAAAEPTATSAADSDAKPNGDSKLAADSDAKPDADAKAAKPQRAKASKRSQTAKKTSTRAKTTRATRAGKTVKANRGTTTRSARSNAGTNAADPSSTDDGAQGKTKAARREKIAEVAATRSEKRK